MSDPCLQGKYQSKKSTEFIVMHIYIMYIYIMYIYIETNTSYHGISICLWQDRKGQVIY